MIRIVYGQKALLLVLNTLLVIYFSVGINLIANAWSYKGCWSEGHGRTEMLTNYLGLHVEIVTWLLADHVYEPMNKANDIHRMVC